jgi:hypothetical protein
MKIILKNTILKAVLFTTIMVAALSCDKHEDLEVGKTALSEASSDWYVQFLVDGEDIYGLGYTLITTANSADETSLWIDDHQHTWWFKVKCPIDIESLKFSAADLNSKVGDYEVDVTITNGTIIKEGTTSPGGSKVDSIYFEAEFSDDPGTIYQLTGHKRTGLAEDEH